MRYYLQKAPVMMNEELIINGLIIADLSKFHSDACVFQLKFMHVKTFWYTFVHEKFSKQACNLT